MSNKEALARLVAAFHGEEDEVDHEAKGRDDGDLAGGQGRDDTGSASEPTAPKNHSADKGRNDVESVGDAVTDQDDTPADDSEKSTGRGHAAPGSGAAAAPTGPTDVSDEDASIDGQGDAVGDHASPPSDQAGGDAVVRMTAKADGDSDGGVMVQQGASAQHHSTGQSTLSQTTLETTNVVRHLLWHKAMVSDEDDGSRLSNYIDMVTRSDEGEHVSMGDAFHRDLAIAFELVMQHHMDPWDLDLSKFAELYLKEAAERGVDLVTAGRIILMAWTVLKLQSDEVAERAVFVEEEEDAFAWDDVPDWGYGDAEWDFTERITQAPQAPIDEKIRHKGDRRVTLMELIGAFEEVHEEAEERQELQKKRLQNRLSLRRKMRGKVGDMMHTEDLQAEIAETWQRILEYPTQPIPFSDLHEVDRVDQVQTFTGILFLAKDGRVQVSQEDFPHGEIWLTPKLPEAETVIDEEATQ